MATLRGRANALTKKRSPTFTTCECTMCASRLDTTTAFKDATGQYWCKDHENRGRLLDFGAKHQYPAISFTGAMKYAIGIADGTNNKYLWTYNAYHAHNDLIDSALSSIGLTNEE